MNRTWFASSPATSSARDSAVYAAGDGESALELVRSEDPDVVVLDLGLPVMDGIETCRQLRRFSDCYVVMLTARADEVDMLIGLAVGADDYVTKPFSPRELVARVRTLLRRPRPSRRQAPTMPGEGAADAAQRRVFGALALDPQAREVTVAGRPVTLTRTEFDLLEALSARPRMVFTRRQLIEQVWGPDWVGDEHLVDVHLGHVRRKLGAPMGDAAVRPDRSRRRVPDGQGMTEVSGSRPPRVRTHGSVLERIGMAPRLFLTNALVILAGASTLLAVALLFAPALFHEHLQRAHLPEISPAVRDHVDQAFSQAMLVALATAVVVATVVAGMISWLVARRLAGPVREVAAAAVRLADGHYDATVPNPRLGPEFASLTLSMNRLSHRLAATEAERRRLTADLAHQLRTPLASVKATVEALSDGVLPPDEPTFAVLADQTERLHRLVGDLEKVSRAEERQLVLDPAPQPLLPLVQRSVAAVRERYRAKGVALALEPTATPAVRVDADRLAEAVGNLLDNALRHTAPGGSVRVTLRPRPSTGGRLVDLVVSDTGEGFEPEEAPLLFRRFHRGHHGDPNAGSGLGLTIARAIAEAHGGTLDARSDGPGRGAELTLTLPTAAG